MNFPKIMGCPCAAISEKDIFNLFDNYHLTKGYTVALNAEKILKYRTDESLRNIINQSILPYPDGSGAVLGLKWLHSMSSEKINMPILALEYANLNRLDAFIVGASESNHNEAIKVIKKRYPSLPIVGNMHGYNSLESITNQIALKKPKIVLLALGSPRQELFAAEILKFLNSGIVIGCGGALDILAGKLKRAPKFWIDNNLEWAYRVIQEPWRLKRQAFLPKFFLGLLTEVIRKRIGKSSRTN
jgi:N-acetylglucosaminyldiphosphoundecaprenol N-acetyl-beta-D-mannosaminyltransferase